jgi:hypothetical protein
MRFMRNTQVSNEMSNSAANSVAIPLPIPLSANSVKLIHVVDIYLIFGVYRDFRGPKRVFPLPAGEFIGGTTTGRVT